MLCGVDVARKLQSRLTLGKKKYGHGVVVQSNVRAWTLNVTDSWLEMAREEFYDALVYLSAALIRRQQLGRLTSADKETLDDAVQMLGRTTRRLSTVMPCAGRGVSVSGVRGTEKK